MVDVDSAESHLSLEATAGVPETTGVPKMKAVRIEDHGASSDEAEFSSSSSSSENDFLPNRPRNTRNNNSLGFRSRFSKDNFAGNASDLGYDSSLSCSSRDYDEDDEGDTELPEDLRVIVEGMSQGLPIVPPDGKPEWFDSCKFKCGQQFATKYYFGVNFAEMLSLLILFSFDDSFKALMFTDQSGTPAASFKRYLSTVLRVKTWYEQDLFDKNTSAYNNIKIVRAMHSSVSKRMNALPLEQVDVRIKRLNDSKHLSSTMKGCIKEDFEASMCPFARRQGYKNPGKRSKTFFNQFSMSTTQFGFLGLIVLHPEKFGAINATEKELEGFVHLWRVVGHLLGVEDRYNFCNGTLAEVKARCRDLLNCWAIPNFTILTEEWEHFSRCLVKGVSFYVPPNSFEISILYLCYVLGINARKFYDKTSWSTYFKYLFFKFTLCCALRVPWLLDLANKSLRMSLSRASNYSNERLSRIERISNEFMKL